MLRVCMKRLPEGQFPAGYCGRCMGDCSGCPIDNEEIDAVEYPQKDELIAAVKAASNQSTSDVRILERGLKGMTKAMDDLISACRSADGPTRQDIARARGMLPAGYVNSFQPNNKGTLK